MAATFHTVEVRTIAVREARLIGCCPRREASMTEEVKACRRTQRMPSRAARSTAHHAISDPGRSALAAGSVTDPDRYRAGSARSASVHPNGGPCS
jgi:hypothetical protein